MDVQRLVSMANDIARYFASEPDREVGVSGIAEHLRKFWTPRMCAQLIAHVEGSGVGLDPMAVAAVRQLSVQQPGFPEQPGFSSV